MSNDRITILQEIGAHVKALAVCEAAAGGAWTDKGNEAFATTVRETMALLQSLLPANPERDAEAQIEMAAKHNARADAEAKACANAAAELTGSYSRGCWTVPTDALNNHFRQAWIKGFRYAKGEP